jgi:Ca2+-binding EF-hand superfamily protein
MNMTEESIMTPRGSPEEETELCMSLFDPDHKGFITLLNLETILIANGFVDDKKAILDLFQTLDTGNRG